LTLDQFILGIIAAEIIIKNKKQIQRKRKKRRKREKKREKKERNLHIS